MNPTTNLLALTEEEARTYLEKIRWPKGIVCLFCGDMKHIIRVGGQKHRKGLLHCQSCRRQFTVTVNTIFEGSHIPLNKWIMAFHLMCSSKKGISSLQLMRMLDLKNYKSAWHLSHRIRHAMKDNVFFRKLEGNVEVDETYVGGKSRKKKRGRGSERKVPVVALVERGGRVVTSVTKDASAKSLWPLVYKNIDKNATLMTDEWLGYRGLKYGFHDHKVVNHGRKEYVRGDAYTNSAESFFSLLKRGIYGSFHSVSKEHLQRYVDEFAFRYNHRCADDAYRTFIALKQTEGKRLTYAS